MFMDLVGFFRMKIVSQWFFRRVFVQGFSRVFEGTLRGFEGTMMDGSLQRMKIAA